MDRRRKQLVAAQDTEHSRAEPSEPIQKMVDFSFETESAGDVVDKLEERAIAERPYPLCVTLAAKAPGLCGTPDLQRGAGKIISFAVAVPDVVFSEALAGASSDSGRRSPAAAT